MLVDQTVAAGLAVARCRVQGRACQGAGQGLPGCWVQGRAGAGGCAGDMAGLAVAGHAGSGAGRQFCRLAQGQAVLV